MPRSTGDTTPKNVLIYNEGDISPEWSSLVESQMEDLIGKWQIVPERSDPVDPIMSKLGISSFKRSFLKKYKSVVNIRIIDEHSDSGGKAFHIVTHLPMGQKKQGVVPVNETPFVQHDGDSGCTWANTAVYHKGRLMQRRTSVKGVMFDVRCIFKEDPEGKLPSSEGPFQLFKWTFIPEDGEKLVCHRWMQKVEV